jgi:hypothetical protein
MSAVRLGHVRGLTPVASGRDAAPLPKGRGYAAAGRTGQVRGRTPDRSEGDDRR